MNRTTIAFLFLLCGALAGPASAQLVTSLATRWNAPSTLTPDQAAAVLAREARGETVSPSQLFEARKHLRSDRIVSTGGTVSTGTLTKLLQDRFDGGVRVRILPIVLQWLESTTGIDANGKEVLHLRGESVGLVAANSDPNLAASLLFHFTIREDWKWCNTSLCLSPVVTPVRSGVGYELAVPLESSTPAEARSSELILASGFAGSVSSQTFPSLDSTRYLGVACDPLPSSTSFTKAGETPSRMLFTHLAERTEHSRTNRILCGFFAIPGGPLTRFTYLADGAIAAPPATAARSAVVNNPLAFALFE